MGLVRLIVATSFEDLNQQENHRYYETSQRVEKAQHREVNLFELAVEHIAPSVEPGRHEGDRDAEELGGLRVGIGTIASLARGDRRNAYEAEDHCNVLNLLNRLSIDEVAEDTGPEGRRLEQKHRDGERDHGQRVGKHHEARLANDAASSDPVTHAIG